MKWLYKLSNALLPCMSKTQSHRKLDGLVEHQPTSAIPRRALSNECTTV